MSWWIGRAERTVVEDVPAAPGEVRDLYVDLDHLTATHPLIVSVTETERSEDADGFRQSYRVVDRLTWGPFTFRTAYRARWHVRPDGEVHTEAAQSPSVRLCGVVTFEPTATGTRVTERISIAAPRPLLGFTAREAAKAHATMLAALRAHFESGDGVERTRAIAERWLPAFLDGRRADDELYAERVTTWHNIGEREAEIQRTPSRTRENDQGADLRVEDPRLHVYDGGWVLQATTVGTNAQGEPVRIPTCLVVTVRDGRIQRFEEYADSRAAEALF